MDLRSFWTAPFPEDSLTVTSNTLELPSSPYFAGEDSTSLVPSTSDGSSIATPAHSCNESSIKESSETTMPSRRRPIPRKGHKKSRRGCYSCKRRKIKCSELKPHCENCMKAGTTCAYPKAVEYDLVPVPPMARLQSTPTLFTMSDMRFLHHFIVRAYPHLPLGADHAWTMEMPAIAHRYEYLMKAMLAHGASHLDLTTTDDLNSQGLKHRVDAVTLLNEALSRPATSKEEYDARFATFMILTFQSTCLRDGFMDFLTMLRGCVLNGQFLEDSHFGAMALNSHMETMDEKFNDAQLEKLNAKTLSEAIASLAQLEELCHSATEKNYHGMLLDVAVNGYRSPKSAYESFVKLYNVVGTMSHEDFQKLVDTSDPVSQLLLSHFLAAHIILRHVSVHEMTSFRSFNDPSPMYNVMMSWMHYIDGNLPSAYQKYNKWPRYYVLKWSPMMANGMWKPANDKNDGDLTLFGVL